MPLTRRQLLVSGAGALALAACSRREDRKVTAPTTSAPAVPLTRDPFELGIASGDPDDTSVVLWTRLIGAEGEHDVAWEVRGLVGDELVAAGVARATVADGHSVHALATGLEPDTSYRYSFRAGEFASATGTTRTAPAGDGGESIRFAFASCQDYRDGHYTAHTHLAEEGVDLVVWLGDYIYESGSAPSDFRQHDAGTVRTLDEYRGRYALYKRDPALQASHAAAPWFVVWDDHEVENNYAGTTVDPARRSAAYKAWWEHQPTRLPPPGAADWEIHRTLRWGGLATFFGLDGRGHRDAQACGGDGDLGPGCPEREVAGRTMLGRAQEAWLAEELPASTATWNVLANQTILAPSGFALGPTELFNLDQWDGYPAARERLFDVLAETRNPVVITGDVHASAVGELVRGDASIGVELVGTSISSSFPADLVDLFELAATASGAKMADAAHRGYVVCTLTADALRADYRIVDTVLEPGAPIHTASSWEIRDGTSRVQAIA